MNLVVSHLTRMRPGYCCVAGLEEGTRRHVRPVLHEANLPISCVQQHGGPFALGAVVDLGAAKPVPRLPRIENHEFDLVQARFLRALPAAQFWTALTAVAQTSLGLIFGPELQVRGLKGGLPLNRGRASLGCLRPDSRPTLAVVPRAAKPAQVRLHFEDLDREYDLGVTDLRFYGSDQAPDAAAVGRTQARLERGVEVLLGMGIGYAPEGSDLQWLQVNNLHLADNPLCI